MGDLRDHEAAAWKTFCEALDGVVDISCRDAFVAGYYSGYVRAEAEGAAVAFGLMGMGREIQLREEEKEIVHMQCEMARQWSGDE